VAQRDGNRGRRSATAALAALGNFGKPAPKVGGEQALWQGGGVVDRFEARKMSEGGSPELSTAALGLTKKRRLKHEPRVEEAGDWVGELRGAAPELRDGSTGGSEGSGWRCTVVPQRRHDNTVGGGGRRKEKGSFTGLGSLYSG
jgi:hypothetical protein